VCVNRILLSAASVQQDFKFELFPATPVLP